MDIIEGFSSPNSLPVVIWVKTEEISPRFFLACGLMVLGTTSKVSGVLRLGLVVYKKPRNKHGHYGWVNISIINELSNSSCIYVVILVRELGLHHRGLV